MVLVTRRVALPAVPSWVYQMPISHEQTYFSGSPFLSQQSKEKIFQYATYTTWYCEEGKKTRKQGTTNPLKHVFLC